MSEDFKLINLQLENPNEALNLFGTEDRHLKQLEEQLQVSIVSRGEQVSVSGTMEDRKMIQEVLDGLLHIIRKGIAVTERDVIYAVDLAKRGKIDQLETLFEDEITKNAKGKSIRVKTLGQRNYLQAMKRDDLVFGIGPAGTGKTYLAVVMAVSALKSGKVKRIILTRLQ